MTGSLKLRDHPGDMVRLACDRCGRVGQYRKQSLIAQFGPDIELPDLRHEIAKCERKGKMPEAQQFGQYAGNFSHSLSRCVDLCIEPLSSPSARLPMARVLRPFLPMGRPNIDGPLSFGVNPRLFATATRKREFVHSTTIHDCKAQVTVGWHILDGTDQVPHAPLLNRAGCSTP